MIRGSEDWLVRALTDWVLTIKQGLALVTYTSFPARQRVIERLESALKSRNLTTEILQQPQAYALKVQAMCEFYLEACAFSHVEPDKELLTPISKQLSETLN